jgi:hypothetical protein
MSPDIGLHLERKGDELIVRGVRTSIGVKLFGAAFAGFSLLWIFLWNRHDAASDLAYANGFLLAAIFIVVGVSLMIPKSVTTIFDLRSRQVRRSVSPLRTNDDAIALAFDVDIAGGFQADGSCSPMADSCLACRRGRKAGKSTRSVFFCFFWK